MKPLEIHEVRRQLRHLETLESIGFNGDFPALVRLERRAHRAAENYCNLANFDWEKASDQITKKATALFNGKLPAGFFVNGDPRGHALKIRTEDTPAGLHTDFGGYGVLAPESF